MLNRPETFNAIDETMPKELDAAVHCAGRDNEAHDVILNGVGRGFSGGYDLKVYAERGYT